MKSIRIIALSLLAAPLLVLTSCSSTTAKCCGTGGKCCKTECCGTGGECCKAGAHTHK